MAHKLETAQISFGRNRRFGSTPRSETAAVRWGGRMEHIAKIGDYITVPNCATIGTVKDKRAALRSALIRC